MEPLNLAFYIINNYHSCKFGKDGITPLKLQKLLYYVKAWSVVAKQDSFDIFFEKWKHGPVNPFIYDYFKPYKAEKIIPNPFIDLQPTKDEIILIDFVVHNYIIYDALTLSAMTHKEDPWVKTEVNQVISEDLMDEYYSKQSFAKNFPLDKAKSFYPIKSNLDYSFVLDMGNEVKDFELIYSSFNEYLTEILNTQKKLEEQIIDFSKFVC